ncbi:hypothetical protein SLS62_001973 [Diatrype stigma]|uniref:Uncharacterized protein n=1 Tax=Diatrype stigma TaxID=117547 RepID=A0AAN9UV73_9PEZI
MMSSISAYVQADLPPLGTLIDTFWGPKLAGQQPYNGQTPDSVNLSAYLEYYSLQWHAIATYSGGRYVTVRKYSDIVDIVKLLRQGEPKESILQNLEAGQATNTATPEAYENSVNLAARLLTMLQIGIVKYQAVSRHCLLWEGGSLADFIKTRFDQPQVLSYQHMKLPKGFNAWSMNVIGGLRIQFTENLDDHLLLIDDDTKVLIFHHASFLECQYESLLPDGLAEETLRTLALIFPQSVFKGSSRWGRERQWFNRLAADFGHSRVDPRLIMCGNLSTENRQLEHFKYWRDRLVILKQAYDDATPRTLFQWWHDRRNGERWYTFWVAVLVLFLTTTLGFVQCAESALQVYKAYYPS